MESGTTSRGDLGYLIILCAVLLLPVTAAAETLVAVAANFVEPARALVHGEGLPAGADLCSDFGKLDCREVSDQGADEVVDADRYSSVAVEPRPGVAGMEEKSARYDEVGSVTTGSGPSRPVLLLPRPDHPAVEPHREQQHRDKHQRHHHPASRQPVL